MPRLYPPIDLTNKWVKLYRGFREMDLTMVFPNGDSYLVSLDEAKCVLKAYQIKKERVERLIDAVWGIYAIQIYFETSEYHSIEPIPEETGHIPGPLDQHTWVLGENDDWKP